VEDSGRSGQVAESAPARTTGSPGSMPNRGAGRGERTDAVEGPRGGRDRGLRDLVGAGPSQVGVSRALRARDVNRPTDDDIAAAERDLVLVHRNWKPKP
jgi:hypothetical protein